MTRINTNVSSLVAQSNLHRANNDLAMRLERLSTGLRINSGADDPAGLIVSERLRGEVASVDQAIDNIERASNVIATTEAALSEINTLLNEMKSLTIEAANTGAFSEEEIEANQLQIDSAVESITRIANTTSFAGLKLLNGGLDYTLSGVTSSEISDVKINGANFGTNANMPVSVEVLNSAETAGLFLSGNSDAANPGTLLSTVTFEVQGVNGVESFTFVSGTAMSAVVAGVNAVSDATGVSASLANAADQSSGVIFNSTGYGSDAFVSVEKLDDGDFFSTQDVQGGNTVTRDTGEDVLALVNGNLALGDGLEVSTNTSTLNANITLTAAAAQSTSTYNFVVTGGGATYQIGPEINSSQQVGFGVQSVAATNLGNSITGFLSSIVSGGDNSLVAGQARAASDILDVSIDQISILRGRLGAFERNTLQTTARSSQIALENLTAAESQIRDADFAEETAALSRAQILQQAGTSTLGIANTTSQSVLSLLGG